MKKSTEKLLKKYHFIIAFGVTFVIFCIIIYVQAAIKTGEDKEPLKVADAVITESNTESGESNKQEMTVSQTETSDTGTKVADNTKTTAATTNNGSEGQTKQFQKVPKSYLDGALFIGDSRTDTLASYSGWSKTNFFVETGLTIWTVMDAKVAKVGGNTVSIKTALNTKKYDKIYIMLGVNELGKGDAQSFYNEYKKVVNQIRKYQPQCILYIQSIMHVTQGKDDEHYYINNKEINRRNEKIKTLANNIDTFWIDENEIFDKGNTGKLNPTYTSDGVHLIPKYIPMWQKFFLSHAIVKN